MDDTLAEFLYADRDFPRIRSRMSQFWRLQQVLLAALVLNGFSGHLGYGCFGLTSSWLDPPSRIFPRLLGNDPSGC